VLDHKPLFQGWSDHLGERFGCQLRPVAGTPRERKTPIVVRAQEPHWESHIAEKCLNH
jgi:hypothetical protein